MGGAEASSAWSSNEVTYCRMWQHSLDALHERLRGYSPRRDTHRNVMAYLDTLLLDVDRKNGWQLAERAGFASPYALQHVLGRASWDHEGMRSALGSYLQEKLGQDELVLVLDETGFVKKGRHSVGVQRQYCGTAGRIENSQVAVFLAYCTPVAHALMDLALFLPKSWATDEARLAAAKVPPDIGHVTKPMLGRQLLERAFEAGVRPAWVVGDAVYGSAALRLFLQQQQQPYILGVQGSHKWVLNGRRQTVAELMGSFETAHWQRVSSGLGIQGPRFHDWLAVRIPWVAEEGFVHWLMARRHLGEDKVSYFVAYAKEGTTLEEAVWACGQRWSIEECFKAAKGLVGLDEYEVRSYHGFYRHMTLCCWAYAFLAAQRLRFNRTPSPKGAMNSRNPESPLPLH